MTDADVATAIGNHVRAFNDRDIDALYELHDGRIAWAETTFDESDQHSKSKSSSLES